jgi:hypothetical protein
VLLTEVKSAAEMSDDGHEADKMSQMIGCIEVEGMGGDL